MENQRYQRLSRCGEAGPLADRIVTTSPDVTITTNLGGWVNQRDVFHRERRDDVFKAEHVLSAQRWAMSPEGQHVELGIAENNLFIFLAALGLAHDLFGARLFPIGVLYDPFIERGLDALNYACYQDARFILVATPSGITLAPEGGAHQSIGTPLIGMAQNGLAAFEPAFVDELAVIIAWAFDYLQRDGDPKDSSWLREEHGGSVYLRLSTRAVATDKMLIAPEATMGASDQEPGRPAGQGGGRAVAVGDRAAEGRMGRGSGALGAARHVGPALCLSLGRRRLPSGARGRGRPMRSGAKELVGFTGGYRESAQSWRELLVDLKARGLAVAPELPVPRNGTRDGLQTDPGR